MPVPRRVTRLGWQEVAAWLRGLRVLVERSKCGLAQKEVGAIGEVVKAGAWRGVGRVAEAAAVGLERGIPSTGCSAGSRAESP